MEILILTNLFPKPEKPFSTAFITNRLFKLQTLGNTCTVYALSFKNSFLLDSLNRIKEKRTYSTSNSLTVRGISYNYERIPRNAISLVLEKFNNENAYTAYCRKFTHKIENQSLNGHFDIVHAHGMYEPAPAGLVAMLLAEKIGVPFVITLHGSDVNYVMEKRKELYISVFEKASACIFVSKALLRKAMSYGYSGQNSVVIPNGYDPELFKPLDKDIVRRDIGVYKTGFKYVGFVGDLKLVKRADKLPNIFKNIAQEVQNTKFIVVGDGDFRKRIESDTKDLDITFTGQIPNPEVPRWMNAMDVMILPSRDEGFGTVIIEAQACGTCVVGSSNGGIPEAIGFEEYVVKDGDDFEERIADKVVEILRNGYDPERLINKAANFTWENIVKKEVEVYREVIERNDKPLRDEGFANSSTELRKGE